MSDWLYIISFHCSYNQLDKACSYLDNFEIDYEFFAHARQDPLIDHSSDIWKITLYSDIALDIINTEQIIKKLSQEIIPLTITRERIKNKDWVSFVQNNFKPIEVENYYIHTSHFSPSPKMTNILINPEQAFGTGEHETTQLCLKAINHLKKMHFYPKNCFDMGSGSGILAIAAYKNLCKDVVASDIDAQSVQICQQNFQLNSVDIKCYHCPGTDNSEIKGLSPFDLVISNILLSPLVALKHDIKEILSEKGFIVLSGFLDHQVKNLVEHYTSINFKLIQSFRQENWSCVIMQKN